jgi:CO dehydrogenase maturation factor
MTKTIALAGKGGVGKTSVAALIIKYLSKTETGVVLAVDADPSSNLHMALGVDLEWTVGDIREDLLSQVKDSLVTGGAAMGTLPGGVSKREHLDYHIRSSLVEADRFDLIAMGRSEGPGCYCAVNHNLREVIDSISRNYQYVVIDNEAGLEHLSRRTTRDVQHLIVISDPSLRGLQTASRIIDIKNELNITIKNTYLLMNRVSGDLSNRLQDEINRLSIPLIGVIPNDPDLEQIEFNGLPVMSLHEKAISYRIISDALSKII